MIRRPRKHLPRMSKTADVPASGYATLTPAIVAATKTIASSSVWTPPSPAEGVALMGLLSKPRHHAHLLYDMRFDTINTLPTFLSLKCRSLRRNVIADSWYHARVSAPRQHIPASFAGLVPPPLPRATECWALMLIAGQTVRDILNLPAWSELPMLDEQGLRVDLAASLHHLGAQLLDSARLANELGEPPPGNSAESAHTRNAIAQQMAGLDIVRESASRHINALRTYRQRLTAVDEQHKLVARADHVDGLDTQVVDLVYRSGGGDIPTTDLTAAATNLADAQQARSQALAEVRGDYLHALRTL